MYRTPAAVVFALLLTVSPTIAQTRPGNATPSQPAPAGGGILGRKSPPQPLQRQGVDYFAGTWAFKWTGRESGLTAGPRTGSVTFTRLGDTPFLEMRAEGTVDGGAAYTESGTLGWHDAQKIMAMNETIALGSGIELLSIGDWTSPIAIRFESAPVNVGAQMLRLKRTFNIISATSFAVAEELSSDGGPYVRLGGGVFTKRTQ